MADSHLFHFVAPLHKTGNDWGDVCSGRPASKTNKPIRIKRYGFSPVEIVCLARQFYAVIFAVSFPRFVSLAHPKCALEQPAFLQFYPEYMV